MNNLKFIDTVKDFEKCHDQKPMKKCGNTLNDISILPQLFNNINGLDVYNTFLYIFYKIQKGIFIKFQDGSLNQMIVFNNSGKNEWGHLIQYEIPKQQFPYYTNPIYWQTNNGVMRFEKPHIDHFHNIEIIFDMLSHVNCKDVEFFLNKRDFPIITKNAKYEPYYNIHGKKLLETYSFTKYAPILSFSKTEDFDDILIPTYEDWARVSSLEDGRIFPKMFKDYSFTTVNWEEKKPMAVFRGSSTGNLINNTRIKLCSMIHPLLDVGITKFSNRLMIQNGTIGFLETDIKLKSKLSFQQQCYYKYIIHIDGHVSAFRLGLELCSGSCLLIVQSSWTCWFSHLLKPFEHYIPIKNDLTDLFEILEWCTQNDERVKKIASNAKQFYDKYLTKKAIINYLNNLFDKLSCSTGQYFYYKIKKNDFLEKYVPKFSHFNDWLSPNLLQSHIELKSLHFRDQICLFFQCITMFQYLQWKYSAYLKQFKIVIEKKEEQFKISELYDHHFRVNYKIIICNVAKIYYVTEDNLTNYGKTYKHNMIDILIFFNKGHTILKNIVGIVAKLFQENPNSEIDFNKLQLYTNYTNTVNFIYEKIYPSYKSQISYYRTHPKPLFKVCGKVNQELFYKYPFPCTYFTNKLFIYRQYIIAESWMNPKSIEFYKKILSVTNPTKLDFTIHSFTSLQTNLHNLQYNPKEQNNVNKIDDNCTKYIRILYEIIFSEHMNKTDKEYYLSLFKPLFLLDKIKYCIDYSRLKTILLFLEQ